MNTNTPNEKPPVYQTITGRRISMANLTATENGFLEKVAKKFNAKQNWTRFAAWWNAEFNATGLSASSVVYRVCQDLEARLGIAQGKVSPPDYRDFLADLIDTQFGSRQDFCKATGVDPGQLSRVLASRADLSMKVLQTVLEVLHANLVIQTDEESRERTSVVRAVRSLAFALGQRTQTESASVKELETPLSRATLQQLIDEQIRPLREQVERLEGELQAGGSGGRPIKVPV